MRRSEFPGFAASTSGLNNDCVRKSFALMEENHVA